MLSLRLFVLFIHVTAVIVALGGSLFSTFALAPVLAEELDGAARLMVARRVIRASAGGRLRSQDHGLRLPARACALWSRAGHRNCERGAQRRRNQHALGGQSTMKRPRNPIIKSAIRPTSL
jgi:hypothetical protein